MDERIEQGISERESKKERMEKNETQITRNVAKKRIKIHLNI